MAKPPEFRPPLLLRAAGATLSGLWAVSDSLRRPAVPAERDRTLALTVARREIVARDENVVALTLTGLRGQALPRWHPGAHLDLHLPSGLIRQYSLCGDPAEREAYRIAVRRIPAGAGSAGAGSAEVHEALPVGSTVTTGGPRNAFPLVIPGYGSPARRLRFIAGGIGITPILPMLAMAHRLGVDWSMIYVGRNADSIPFRDEVQRFGTRVRIRTDDLNGVPTADELLGEFHSATAVYVCGPPPLLTAVCERLTGRDDVELHYERFAAPPVVDGAQFSATAVVSGADVVVGPEETLLAALRRAGVNPPYSCQQGFCGTCRVRVLGGSVQHRDTLLTDAERVDQMLLCVSRAGPGGHLELEI